ncbi:uncharacterized protein LOC125679402 isoform X2 [Ostrea edulis]|uniref:uncharacterized protein LOC125679402 isoform X2 n=1 Tax=Ostrea edulis TaxID=37623 RepID=UPI0024AFE82A|nr:uncharacterized protein LOC125679402 isoform X2 [Ostrea edulis]
MSAEECFPTGAQEAIPEEVSTRINFQVRFVLGAIFSEYKDKHIKKRDIIKLGNDLLERGVLTIERSDWESLKKKDKLDILSQIFNVPRNLRETFTTRDICMKWVYDLSRSHHKEFLQRETEYILERLCDVRTAHRVSEQWCVDNNFKTEDSSDVLDNICKALGKSDIKESVTKYIKDELKQRGKEFDKFQQKEWISAAIDSPEAITWNPLLFDVCATKFDTVIQIIAYMALPTNRDVPVMCECRIYPQTNYRAAKRISATTFIRKKFETYVGAVQGTAILGVSKEIDVFNGILDTMGKMETVDRRELENSIKEIREHFKNINIDHMKVISENERMHQDLQEAEINNRKLLEEKEELLRQLKSKAQKDVDDIAILERETNELKSRNKKLTTKNTNLKESVKENERKIQEKNREIDKQSKRIDELERKMNSILTDANRSGRSSVNRSYYVQPTPNGSLRSETHK